MQLVGEPTCPTDDGRQLNFVSTCAVFEEPYYYSCRPGLVDKASREIPREITSFNLIGCG